jgi:hypothetical protein
MIHGGIFYHLVHQVLQLLLAVAAAAAPQLLAAAAAAAPQLVEERWAHELPISPFLLMLGWRKVFFI